MKSLLTFKSEVPTILRKEKKKPDTLVGTNRGTGLSICVRQRGVDLGLMTSTHSKFDFENEKKDSTFSREFVILFEPVFAPSTAITFCYHYVNTMLPICQEVK